MIADLRAALGFLTILPGRGAPNEATLHWFGPIGAGVGLVVGVVAIEGRGVWPALVAATLAVMVDAVLTGGLHLDGLADSGDGLIVPVDRPRRLEIMHTPEIGAFGAIALLLVLLLRVTTLATAADALAVAAVWAAARATAALTIQHVPYAREGGLATAFRPASGRQLSTVTSVVTIVVAVVVASSTGFTSALAVAAAVGGGVSVVLVALRRLGGFTGDVLGAAIVVAETVGLVVLATT